MHIQRRKQSNRKWSKLEIWLRSVVLWLQFARAAIMRRRVNREMLRDKATGGECDRCSVRYRCGESPHRMKVIMEESFQWPHISLN